MEIDFNFDEIETIGKNICDLVLLKKECNWNLIEYDDHSEFHLIHPEVTFKIDCINYDNYKVIILNSNTVLKYHDILESLSFLSMNLNDSYFWYLPELENLQKKYTGSYLKIDEEDPPHQKTLNNDCGFQLFSFLKTSQNK